MQTLILDGLNDTASAIRRAAELLQSGELVAFATETVYGLGARIYDEDQIEKVYVAKERPSDNPLIAHVADVDEMRSIVSNMDARTESLVEAFFPGPLTLVLERARTVPAKVSAGSSTIAVRMPANTIAQTLIREVGQPLVAPSANKSGRPSPTTARHVMDDMAGRIAAILDGGACEVGLESTVLSLVHPVPTILRPGSVSRTELMEFLKTEIDIAGHDSPVMAPGMKYRHYAPRIPVRIVEMDRAPGSFDERSYVLVGKEAPATRFAHTLLPNEYYAQLRRAEQEGYEQVVIIITPDLAGNDALMERMRKSASE